MCAFQPVEAQKNHPEVAPAGAGRVGRPEGQPVGHHLHIDALAPKHLGDQRPIFAQSGLATRKGDRLYPASRQLSRRPYEPAGGKLAPLMPLAGVVAMNAVEIASGGELPLDHGGKRGIC
jgi:hypothetical protein